MELSIFTDVDGADISAIMHMPHKIASPIRTRYLYLVLKYLVLYSY